MTTSDDRLEVSSSADDHAVASAVEAWLRANLPDGWLSAVDAGDWPRVDVLAADPEVSAAWFERMGAAGLATAAWPVECGGLGLPAGRAAIVAEALARYRADRPERDFVGLALAGPTIMEWGTKEQRAARLPALARGHEVWCQLFSEPGAGSDLAALRTRAVRQDDGTWRITGQKVWSSYAHLADFGLLLARTDPDVPKHAGITYFLLDMRTRGVCPRPLRQMTGNAEFNEVFLDDVAIPDSARLGPVGSGWAVALTTLMQERHGLSGRPSVGPGVVEELVGTAVQHGTWEDPLLRDRLVSAFVTQYALQAATVRGFAAAGRDAPTAEGSIRKLAHALLTEALGQLGTEIDGNSLAWEPGQVPESTARFLGLKTYSIAGGTSEIQRNIIAERLLGMPRDPDPERGVPFRETGRG